MNLLAILSLLAASLLAFAGCRGIPAPGEQQARHDRDALAPNYAPATPRPPLPVLTPNSSLSNYLAFALLNSPSVRAAFYDWSASVENITVTRSLPDPQLTLQAYLTDTLTSLMPGLAWNFPGPGKIPARTRVATAASTGKYFAFETAVLQAAFDVRKAYYNLALLDDQLRLNRASLALLDGLNQATLAQNDTGQGALTAVFRLQNDRERLRTDVANLADSRRLVLANFKAALGLRPGQPDPPVPAHFEAAPDGPADDELLRLAFEHNPQLKALQADVRAAEGGIAMAYQERVPDFSVGASADVYAPPFFWPQAGMTLPIWRDKLAAENAQARANDLAAEGRLQAAQINLAVTFAEKAFACRETGRNRALIENTLLPQARQSLAALRAGYQVGSVPFASLTDAERLPLDLELAAAQARADHQIALAELSLLVAGVPPPGAPFSFQNR